MKTLPTPEEVRSRLALLSHAQMLALAEVTKAPFTTLWKIRGGVTTSPRLSTVCAIWPELVKKPSNRQLNQLFTGVKLRAQQSSASALQHVLRGPATQKCRWKAATVLSMSQGAWAR